jgi:uncharacterized protein Yka (UPF0111/DUF47 family)
MKSQILAAIGESELGRAAQVNAALSANDRIKYYFSLLQMAMARADHPEQPAANLRQERVTCGIDEPALDDVVGGTRREGNTYRVPGCQKVLQQVVDQLRIMAAPVAVEQGPFAQRLESLLARIPAVADDLIQRRTIQEMTRAGSNGHDSLHQFVMDAHKRLNTMQVELAEQRLDGAAVYNIDESDRALIGAFMAGLNRTAPLKFDHPGLEATATRSGDTLIIQNDLGTTEAHVVVIHVKGMAAHVTYTDVHPERARFFRDMLKRYAVNWSQDRGGQLPDAEEDANFTLLVGSYDAKDQADLEEYLSFLGSRLVFVIDWNRARKQLRPFLRGRDRVGVLRWAADAEVGHRGFLELGGAQIINQAIERVSGSAMHFGDRLCEVLADDAAVRFVQFVFRAATEGLKEHQSPGLIQDRVRAELQARFASEGERLLQIAGEHAGIVFELATQIRDGVQAISCNGNDSDCDDLAKRARAFEHDADQLVVAAREAMRKRPEYAPLFKVTEAADDAADELEEVAFLLGLLKATRPGGEALDSVAALTTLLVEASQEWIKALSCAVHVKRGGQQEDADDFLLAIDRLLALEHQADDAERALTYAVVQRARNFRQLHLYSEIGGSLEAAADALKSAGLIARDHLFANVLGA